MGSPGTKVIDLVAVADLRVDIPVPQKYYPLLQADTPIELAFDALPDGLEDLAQGRVMGKLVLNPA